MKIQAVIDFSVVISSLFNCKEWIGHRFPSKSKTPLVVGYYFPVDPPSQEFFLCLIKF